MNKGIRTFRRNLFEIDNARNLTREEVVGTFVPPQSFWRLLSPKNHILLGSRGSGKTAIAKMLSHEHLTLWRDSRAKEAVQSKSIIGMYLPVRLEWVGSLRNKPWQTSSEKEDYFCWRLNAAACSAFLNTLRSCLSTYIGDIGERARLERAVCEQLTAIICGLQAPPLSTITSLEHAIDSVEYERQMQFARMRALGLAFNSELPAGIQSAVDLFAPLRRAIAVAQIVLRFPDDAAWILCIDEAEFLDDEHQAILNSHMRSYSKNLFFKVTTLPYHHHASETITHITLDSGHDFDYVYLDSDPVFQARSPSNRGQKEEIGTKFGRKLFKLRANASGPKYSKVSIDELLGKSQLLDASIQDWGEGSSNLRLLRRYASEETVSRAERLLGSKRFQNEIGRKIHGALLLRHTVATTRGKTRLTVYSGSTMALRCGDSNARRLVRVFNGMILATRWRGPAAPNIGPTK